MKNVVKAIWDPRVQLGMTGLFLILIEYYFTIMGYIRYWRHYSNEELGDRCENMLLCLITTFDYSFKETGGVGAYLEYDKAVPTDVINLGKPMDMGRWLYDNIFIIVLI